MNERRPLAKADPRRLLAHSERLVGSTVRLAPSNWVRIDEQALIRGFSRLVMARKLLEFALDYAEEQSRMEATVGVPRRGLGGSLRVRRF